MTGLIANAERVVVATAAPYLGWLKGAAILAAAGTFAYAVHWVDANYYGLKISDMQVQQQQALIIAGDAARRQQEDQDKITASVIADALQKRNAQLQQMIANLQRTPQYVTPETDRAFPLPCGFLRMHDAGASGTAAAAVPLPTGKADGDRCDVATSIAASVIQTNYGLALGWKAERDSWWDWYGQQQAKWDQYRASAPKEN
jgi:hypothetical protein